MEVNLVVPRGTDISVIRAEYFDIEEDDGYDEDFQSLWIGGNAEDCFDGDDDCGEWIDYDEAVEFCGFCEGAIDEASTLIAGNGGWAQGMISRKDFSGLAATDGEKANWKATSDRYWAAFERGKAAAASHASGNPNDPI